MNDVNVDVAVVGAGTAGLNARRAALDAGATVALIEGGPHGTTCARVGCMPSKLLIQSADFAHEARHADAFGVGVEGVAVRGADVLKRVRSERDRFVGFILRSVDRMPPEQRITGTARFIDSHTLQVDDHTRVSAKAIVLATGSSPWLPPNLRDLGPRGLTNDHIFEREELPESIAVVGAGVIGLELGQAMHRLGVRTVCLSHSPRVGPAQDPVVQEKARAIFGDELDMHMRVRNLQAVSSDVGVSLQWQGEDGSSQSAEVEVVLVAAGRRPNLSGLDLHQAGVKLGEDGRLPCNRETGQVGDSHIFMAGDVSDYRPILHEAADEGRIAGANAARFPAVQAEERRTPLAIVFSDPQIAVVGPSFHELSQQAITIGEVSYDDQGRARIMGKNRGIVRLYADTASGVLLGAEMVGPRVEHTSHLLAWAVQQKTTVEAALKMPFYHPVVEEGLRTGLQDLLAKLAQSQ